MKIKQNDIGYDNWFGMSYKEAHKKMWKWLAKNPTKTKYDWLELYTKNFATFPMNCCFACEASHGMCDLCPIMDNVIDECLDGLFEKYCYAQSDKERSKFAKEISKLKWRKKV